MLALGVFEAVDLHCPDDRNCCMHLGPVIVTTGTKITTITGDGTIQQVPGGPGGFGRGSTATVKLYAECGRTGEWSLRFHKGQVTSNYRWFRRDLEEQPEPPWPLLWRD